ncbi:hypothetical protein LEP1GSC064_4150 [Leptospira kirschneri serovar Grippotyphosa str. Moskva]|nr:hypothetical protein LEP1GSC018_2590 [Leptospira kirschneri str. 2008720114]EKQ82328.1 hypothetical protein LEP1GSC064_4150 [Leptospira kirschneri serovar Grippotyphosa str. Moskva]EMK01264.1 hypothetical protein LEP1GSC176_1236 [Leptospira kirschneri str. MMD1493]EMO81553.1 hypothetical protein LEP1GSC126_0526 [Leptospira kirschneri str. 200801774]
MKSCWAAGADVNAADESDWTPIWLASKFEPFMALIQHGITVNSRD